MHHETKPDTTRPLIIAALFILATAGGAAALVSTSSPAGPVAQVVAQTVDHEAADSSGVVTLPSGEKHAVAGPTPSAASGVNMAQLKRRLAFANELERRYRARELPITAKVSGQNQRIFTFRWTLKPNPDQLRAMKHAEPLWRELKDLGFRRVEMLDHQATKTLWYKDL